MNDDDDRKHTINENIASGYGNYDGTDAAPVVHRAALTFRHAIRSLNLTSKLFAAPEQHDHPSQRRRQQQQLQEDEDLTDSHHETTVSPSSLYEGYIQTHSMMKLTNLRPVKFIGNGDTGHEGQQQQQHYQLRQQVCTQTWPGQLSLLNERLLQPPHNANNNNNNVVTCLNSAEIWCDHPNCNQARCGPQGCLRCYRFILPPPLQYQQQQQQQQQQQLRENNRLLARDLDGPGDNNILGAWRTTNRECSERNYDFVSFVKCDWCSVSLCNEHIDTVYNGTRRRGGGVEGATCRGRRQDEEVWYKCDECNISSCPQCISQVFTIHPPQMCHVITAGKKCGRQLCSNCIWAVGKEGPMDNNDNIDDCASGNNNIIPGGKIRNDDDLEVVSIRARDDKERTRITRLKEKEMCCSKCLRHVEFRWRELSVVLNMFDGFVP
jgi:hypothetical protein